MGLTPWGSLGPQPYPQDPAYRRVAGSGVGRLWTVCIPKNVLFRFRRTKWQLCVLHSELNHARCQFQCPHLPGPCSHVVLKGSSFLLGRKWGVFTTNFGNLTCCVSPTSFWVHKEADLAHMKIISPCSYSTPGPSPVTWAEPWFITSMNSCLIWTIQQMGIRNLGKTLCSLWQFMLPSLVQQQANMWCTTSPRSVPSLPVPWSHQVSFLG